MPLRSLTCCTAAMRLSLAACAPEGDETAEAPAATSPATATDLSTPRAVHEALIIPGSNLLFTAESEPPTDDAAWAAVQAGAQQVIDGALALQSEPLAQGRADWSAFAQTVIDNTKLTAEALAQKNADDLVFTNGDMMSGCTGCHQAYRQAPQ
jgi:hypothetical protein